MQSVLVTNGKTAVCISIMNIHSVNIIAELMKHEIELCLVFSPKGTTQLFISIG